MYANPRTRQAIGAFTPVTIANVRMLYFTFPPMAVTINNQRASRDKTRQQAYPRQALPVECQKILHAVFQAKSRHPRGLHERSTPYIELHGVYIATHESQYQRQKKRKKSKAKNQQTQQKQQQKELSKLECFIGCHRLRRMLSVVIWVIRASRYLRHLVGLLFHRNSSSRVAVQHSIRRLPYFAAFREGGGG